MSNIPTMNGQKEETARNTSHYPPIPAEKDQAKLKMFHEILSIKEGLHSTFEALATAHLFDTCARWEYIPNLAVTFLRAYGPALWPLDPSKRRHLGGTDEENRYEGYWRHPSPTPFGIPSGPIFENHAALTKVVDKHADHCKLDYTMRRYFQQLLDMGTRGRLRARMEQPRGKRLGTESILLAILEGSALEGC